MTGLTSLLLYLMGITTQIWMAYMGEFNGGSHAYLLKWAMVLPSCTITLHDEGRSEYNFGYHPKNHRSGLVHTQGDQNQPLFKSPCGSH